MNLNFKKNLLTRKSWRPKTCGTKRWRHVAFQGKSPKTGAVKYIYGEMLEDENAQLDRRKEHFAKQLSAERIYVDPSVHWAKNMWNSTRALSSFGRRDNKYPAENEKQQGTRKLRDHGRAAEVRRTGNATLDAIAFLPRLVNWNGKNG